jgi:DNA-binding transcriptional ArsR family regulator
MKKVAGLWIDHRKAIVVTLSDTGEETTTEVLSNVEKQLGRSHGERLNTSFESQQVPDDDKQQRGFTKHLKAFYDDVLSTIRDAHAVLIFGPGEAKGELKKLMEQGNLGKKILAIETVDKMTNREVAAKVREGYAIASNR